MASNLTFGLHAIEQRDLGSSHRKFDWNVGVFDWMITENKDIFN